MKLKDVGLDIIPEEFLSCDVIYIADWNSYEESGWIVIFDFYGEMFCMGGGCCVFDTSDDVFDPQLVTDEDLIDIKEEWDNYENTLYYGL